MLPRVNLCVLPTPCHRLDRLSERLGVDLWIKRDDLTGFAMGGNKGRKLEFLMAEALAQGAEAVVTCGASQSNFVRQLAAACQMLGLECHAALMALPYAALHGKPKGKDARGGNLVLDRFFGANLTVFPDDDWEVLYDHAERIAVGLEASKRVYRIPVGGSSGVGAFSFVEAFAEIPDVFDVLITPCSSGSTHVGLSFAARETATQVIGVACDPEPEIMEDLVRIWEELEVICRLSPSEKQIDFRLDWAGEAYGISSPEGVAAMRLLAETEGILLDPIYSAKAFAGLLALVESGEISGRVLFWHTGGMPTLFAGDGIA